MIVIFLCIGVLFGCFSIMYLQNMACFSHHARKVCPHCHHVYLHRQCIPVISYLLSLGKCPYCKCAKDSYFDYVMLLALTLNVTCFVLYRVTWKALLLFIMLGVLVLMAIIDAKEKKVPTFLLIIFIVGAVLSFPFFTHLVLLDRLVGMFAFPLILVIIRKLRKNSVGEGDVYFLSACGFMFGIWGEVVIVALSYGLAAIVSIVLLALKKVNRKTQIPMFPFFFVAYLTYLVFFINLVTITMA